MDKESKNMCTQTKSEFNEKPQKYSQSNTQSPYVLTNSIHIFTHTTTDLYHNGNSNNLEKTAQVCKS